MDMGIDRFRRGTSGGSELGDREQFWNVWMQGEISNPGGAAFAVAHSVALNLEREPLDSVSQILQMGVVRAGDHEIVALRRERRSAWSAARVGVLYPGEVITSWKEFNDAAGAAGLDGNAAVT